MSSDEYYLIDPPITPYSSKEKIQAWLDELSEMPQDNEQLQQAIAEAKSYLTEEKPKEK
jgi:hypothetical protein